MPISDAFRKENSSTKLQDVRLRDAALVLREIILSKELKPLPENLVTDSLLHGATNVPLNNEPILSIFNLWSWFEKMEN